ncbi:MAG: exodeoxyribonuclease III [Myxococcales bacterium]|jgi:exodeoxyribonuclease-3|nr:exodeoxyribonuclease III [Myxococcales bacterium]MBL0194607.1 exodeoxyribonuclease III [Myxococcales bacterium]HQY64232.1 exodeoxyribonuclease III [Polyangiaceae bacterium]
MKIASYNVNSLRAREARVLAWLAKEAPDVLCLQELKLEEEKFPHLEIAALGYKAAVYGQKTYNGVAILSRHELTDVERGFGDGADDPQARFIAATTGGVRVMCAYMPNGESPSSDKYAYKLAWFDRLTRWLAPRLAGGSGAGRALLLGDYNVAPTDLDVHDPAAWAGSALCSAPERAAFQGLLDLGLVDTFRALHPEEKAFSWWDYRMLGFPKNRGLRIDHVLVTRDLMPRLTAAWIDRAERKGKQPSDHAPVLVELSDT